MSVAAWIRLPRAPTALAAQQWTATLAAVSAFVGTAISGDVGAVLVAAFAASVVGAAWWGTRTAQRFVWVWNVALAAALFVLGSQVLAGTSDLVLAAMRFVVLLLVHRLWNRKTLRDELVLLLLSLLLLCGGAALTAELVFGLAFVVYAVAATWALALLHLRGEIESGRSAEESQALLASRRVATPRLLGALAALALAGLVGSMLVFVAFPRVSIGGFRRVARARAVPGLSNRIDLGGAGTVSGDPRVVLRVRLHPPVEGDMGYHWRAYTLDAWTGRGWAERPSVPRPASRLPRPPFAIGRNEVQRAEIETVAGFTDGVVLTPPGWPISVTFSRPPAARGTGLPRLFRNGAGDLSYNPPDATDLTYTVLSSRHPPTLLELRNRGRRYPADVAGSLVVPRGLDPRVRQLAAQLTDGLDPADAADKVETWLRSNLRYTRQLSDGGDDPIADFIFHRREGHCELFASAMVLMLRSAGIPARAVSGYYGGKWSAAGYHVVRAGDAHAWVEVFFPGVGFTAFDPTPASERGDQRDSVWARMILIWDAVTAKWRSNVVDFDLVQQGRMLRSIASTIQDVSRRFASRSPSGSSWSVPWARFGAAAAVAAALGLAVFLFLRRRGPRRGAGRADERRAMALWRRARARLHRAGVDLPAGVAPREALRRTSRLGAPAQAAATTLVSRYLETRWGGSKLVAAEARELLRDLDRAL